MTPYPDRTNDMPEPPEDEMRGYLGPGLLAGKRALVTGGDSGIGRAVSAAFAKEGADVAIAYLEEHDDARRTAKLIESSGRKSLCLAGDLADPEHLRGNKTLIDYSATKGAVIAFAYALAQSLQPRGIRVNCVAPAPVWTPLIPATMDAERVASFGENAPYGRPAQPDEIAPSYVFFAAGRLSSYYSGEVLAPIGGETLPG